MLRFITILCLVSSAVTQKGNSELDNAFVRPENYTISNLQCENIEGSLKGCYECYLCNEEKILEKKRLRKHIAHLVLVNGDCNSTTICCISQRDLSLRVADTSCGASNPTGYPYSERPRLRAVLPGEYPWRAWVYSIILICLGEKRAVVTVAGLPDASHANDIALISLESFTNIPRWVKPACLPEIAQLYGSTCVGVSDNDNSINFGIPKQSKCKETKPQLAPSLTCAIGAPRDYKHEYGGGLFCLTNNKKRSTYVVYGIALYRHGDEVSMYTDIYKMRDWITNNIPNF